MFISSKNFNINISYKFKLFMNIGLYILLLQKTKKIFSKTDFA